MTVIWPDPEYVADSLVETGIHYSEVAFLRSMIGVCLLLLGLAIFLGGRTLAFAGAGTIGRFATFPPPAFWLLGAGMVFALVNLLAGFLIQAMAVDFYAGLYQYQQDGVERCEYSLSHALMPQTYYFEHCVHSLGLNFPTWNRIALASFLLAHFLMVGGFHLGYGRKPFTFWLLGLCAVFFAATLLAGLSVGFVVDHIYSDQAGCYGALNDEIFPYSICRDGEEPGLHPLRYIPQTIFLLVSLLLLTWLTLVYRKRRKLQREREKGA